ncbi:FHA domain-containing protein [Thermodesulfobacteriota bacterium]
MRIKYFSNPFLALILSSLIIFLSYMLNVPPVSAVEVDSQLDIMIVLDNSGSMKKNDPLFMAGNVVYNVLQTKVDTNIGLVVFDTHPELEVKLLSSNDITARADILKSLDNMDYKGLYSDTPAAVEMALYELKVNGRPDSQKIILLMTDGIVDTGNKQTDGEKWRWLRDDLMVESKRLGIKIFGIAFNNMADFRLLQTLALNTGGDYFRVENSEDSKDIFNKILEITFPEPDSVTSPGTEDQEIIHGKTMEDKVIRTDAKQLDVPVNKESRPIRDLSEGESDIETGLPVFLIFIWIIVLIFIVIIIFYIKSRYSEKGKPTVTTAKKINIPRAVLIDINNITGEKSISLDKQINMIGRDPNNDVVIPNDTVSSFHAIIEYKDGFFYVEDHRSMNKTRLGGEVLVPETSRRLKSGDILEFNVFKFKFVLPDTIPSGETTIDFHGAAHQVQPKKSLKTPGLEIPELPKVILVDVENCTGEKTIQLKKQLNKIGRGSGNDVRIEKSSVSGLHATIEYRDGFFYLEDQRSKNRTTLGGREIESNKPEKLKSGDEIIFDTFKFIFLLEYELPSGDTEDTTIK